MTAERKIDRLPASEGFARPASRAALERAAESLRGNGMDVHIVETGSAARELLFSLLPDGATVGQGASVTLEQIGATAEIDGSGRFDSVRLKTRSMDRAAQGDEIRQLMAAPAIQVNSVQAVTEDGRIVMAAGSGNNIAAVVYGAGKVILVAGSQKVVPDLATALDRVRDYSYPMEDARFQEAYGARASLNKIFILQGERPGRVTVILVDEVLGF
jgi:hypothetical protein